MAGPQDMRPFIRSAALTVTGEFLLVVGAVFALLGISQFVTDYIGIKGVGEFLVGISLVIIAFALLWRSKSILPKIPKKKKEEPVPSEDYR